MAIPQSHLDAFRSAFACRSSPCTYGTFPVAKDSLVLFYGKKGETSRRVDFPECSEADLEALAGYCEPATFGLNDKDVLDETYRKAGKLDSIDFATNFSPDGSGLVEHIRGLLLEGHGSTTAMRCELYKLNVYGPGSFFKEHKDTPRGEDMFATLVVVLPTAHEGGELIFRQNDQEFDFDSATAVQQQSGTPPRVAFAAFFSDVSHEVLEVRSGYRVTLTWNLYFRDSNSAATATDSVLERNLTTAFREMLADDAFLPQGGFLGFGLRHEYPVDEATSRTRRFCALNRLRSSMKGSDAALMRICQALSLKADLQMVYIDHGVEVLCPGTVYLGSQQIEECLWQRFRRYGGRLLTDVPKANLRFDRKKKKIIWQTLKPDIEVKWITDKRYVDANFVKTAYIAYGNQAQMDVACSTPVLVVEVGPTGDRSGSAVTRATLGGPQDLFVSDGEEDADEREFGYGIESEEMGEEE